MELSNKIKVIGSGHSREQRIEPGCWFSINIPYYQDNTLFMYSVKEATNSAI